MSIIKIAIVVAIVIAIIGFAKFRKSPRDKAIDTAVKDIFAIKFRHHELIVTALENGATDDEHKTLLQDKEIEVLAAMGATEIEFNIVIDKKNPTTPGPVVVLDRRDVPRN